MSASLLQFPYREARDGYWGPHTSTLNWCEEDYNISYYCAELINTVTNVTFLYLGAKGIRNVLAYGHSPVFILAFLGYMVVGFGSMAFHATLYYSMQLADELPMIYTVCIMCFVTFSYKRPFWGQVLVWGLMVLIAGGITAYYLHAKDPVFHQVAYGLLTATTIFRGMYIMEYTLRPTLRKRNPEEADQIMTTMWHLAATGILTFLAGFFIWNMDNIFCRQLIAARDFLQLPWAVVLEGHGWWHILTGIGAYYLILWRVWLVRVLDGSEHEYMLHWPSFFTSVPEVVPRPSGARKDGSKKRQ
ncbi:alkaline phytoceramidase [Thozetella sp. PMI_491]|nr:alkaline phytoceramidase [Thozetella sp. PMI_491]